MVAFWESELEGTNVVYHSVAGDEFAAGDLGIGEHIYVIRIASYVGCYILSFGSQVRR